MKLYTTLLFTLIFSSVVYSADYQTISDNGLIAADGHSSNIKRYLRDAKKFTSKVIEARTTIESNPTEYDPETVQAEWDEVIDDLKNGLFCRGCHRSKREYGPGFEAHAAENGGTEPASQADYDRANSKYSEKLKIAQNLHATYDNADAQRRSSIASARALITSLIQSYQLSYDFQLKAYAPFKKDATEAFQKISRILTLQNDRVLSTPKENENYKNYVEERFETTVMADQTIDSLNKNRMNLIKQAETKRQHFIATTQEIQAIASTLGNEDYLVPGAMTVTASFNYDISLGEYISIRSPEKIEKFFDANSLTLYKKVKVEGR